VIRVGEGATAADRHETRIAILREDHGGRPESMPGRPWSFTD
jgi:hypothetical protein